MHSPLWKLEQTERKALLTSCIEQLQGRDIVIILMHYDGGFTFAEIASALEITPSAVSQRHSKSMALLKADLNSRGIEHIGHIL